MSIQIETYNYKQKIQYYDNLCKHRKKIESKIQILTLKIEGEIKTSTFSYSETKGRLEELYEVKLIFDELITKYKNEFL